VTLWVVSSLPVIFAVLFSIIPEGDASIEQKFVEGIRKCLSVSELFVYAASFLSPLLYIIFEKYRATEIEHSKGSRISETFKRVFDGYQTMFFSAIVILVLTAAAYTAAKTSSAGLEDTFLYGLLPNLAWYVYAFSLVCWYMSILEGVAEPVDFVSVNRASEDALIVAFTKKRKTNQ
jgi:hypothetical protein